MRLRRPRPASLPEPARWPDGRQVCACARPGCGDSIPGRRRVAEAQAADTPAVRPDGAQGTAR